MKGHTSRGTGGRERGWKSVCSSILVMDTSIPAYLLEVPIHDHADFPNCLLSWLALERLGLMLLLILQHSTVR